MLCYLWLGNHPGGWWVGPLVAGRVGGWVRWLIEFVGFVVGFTFLFFICRVAGGNVL